MHRLNFPDLPLSSWKGTKDTLHLYLQIVGKVRLALHPPVNHWWHVPFYVSPRGLTTRNVPLDGESFEIEFDFCSHELAVRRSDGRIEAFGLYDGLTVANFYQSVAANLAKLEVPFNIKPEPYEVASKIPFPEDTEHSSYDKESVELFHQTLVAVNEIFEEFRGRFAGKSTPVHLFWHSFDLALTRFSGKHVKPREGAGMVEREAYSQEVISFGFWFGDDKTVAAPAFYSYTAPEPAGLTDEPLAPAAAKWDTSKGAIALLMYDDIRQAENPKQTVLDFLESAYLAGARSAGWYINEFSFIAARP